MGTVVRSKEKKMGDVTKKFEMTVRSQRPSMEVITQILQVIVPNSSTRDSKGNKQKKKVKHSPQAIKGKYDTLDEVILIPNWDTKNLTYDRIKTLQELLAKKTKQEETKRKQQKEVLYEIKDIFLEIFFDNLNE
jgi:hypothetical protein